MWNRKDLKKKAKAVVKRNYWTLVIGCFILSVCTGEFGTSTAIIENNDESASPVNPAVITDIVNQNQENTDQTENAENSENQEQAENSEHPENSESANQTEARVRRSARIKSRRTSPNK